MEIQEPFPPSMMSDQTRFRQILLNLIANAIKFTDHGEVAVAARGMPRGDGPRMLEVTVRDTGVGITAEQRASLFQPFSQADVLAGRPRGGSGLGLALARNLARALGGDLVLVGSEGTGGSTFRLDVRLELEPLAPTTVPLGDGFALQVDPNRGVSGFPGGTRVLLVEDNADIQEIVRRILESIGAEVATAENGLECLRHVESGAFDLVVMDMQMPMLDGFETSRRLRRSGCKTPIVAITAFAMSGEREKCLSAGCNDFLVKPVDALSLIRTVIKWVPGGSPQAAPPGGAH
jgi:CheY-like chemotaxis protein